MHQISYQYMSKLAETYIGSFSDQLIIDIGSYDVNGSYRAIFDRTGWKYIGVDLAEGNNVDVVLDSPYHLPFQANFADCIVSGQTFEHIEFFWLTWNEMIRVLKPGGFIFLIAPSCGWEHRYPVDCWRFYADGFRALAKYGDMEIVEVHSDLGMGTEWGDTVGVFRKRGQIIDEKTKSEGACFSVNAAGKYRREKIISPAGGEFADYYQFISQSLVVLLHTPPRLVLDIGCASGRLGEQIKSLYPGVRVEGIESKWDASSMASGRLDQVIMADVDKLNFTADGIAPGSVDTVILENILENHCDAWQMLQRVRPCLSSDGRIIASMPNIRNLTVFQSLGAGSWEYQKDGLLDIAHICFFTLKDIAGLFQQSGYQVMDVRVNIDKRLSDFFERNRNNMPQNINVGRITINNVSEDELKELCALQFVVAARPVGVVRQCP